MSKRKRLPFSRNFFGSSSSHLILWLIILGLIALAIFIIGFSFHITLLQGLGGVLRGAALSLFITIVTSREAVLQQNAKEANLARKNGYYIPVFNELKQLYAIIEDAKQKRFPYPQWIKVSDSADGNRTSLTLKPTLCYGSL